MLWDFKDVPALGLPVCPEEIREDSNAACRESEHIQGGEGEVDGMAAKAGVLQDPQNFCRHCAGACEEEEPKVDVAIVLIHEPARWTLALK